jgi:Bifunctional DNA primase/polymerase, N-terminal
MTDATLRQALAYAARSWPVFPCHLGQKTPATAHGYRDATTDPEQITAWFGRNPHWNLAIATGTPGPDVLDVDEHGPAGNGYAAFAKLNRAGLLNSAAVYVRTPSGGLHAYFRGSDQRNGHLATHHLDFRSRGGYVLAPPSLIDGKPYQLIRTVEADGGLDWAKVTGLLEPRRQTQRPRLASDRDLSHLARWVASQAEGNRNAGLFWAANRALEADPAADLSPLAAAARRVGLDDKEITRTLDSARRTGHIPPDHQAEAVTWHEHQDLPSHPRSASTAQRRSPGHR